MKKLGNSFAGVLIGFVLLVVGTVLLWWNEGNNVRNLKATGEASKVLIDVSNEKVDRDNEGKLVATNGKVAISGEAADPVFGVKANTAHMVREVEMFQWQESVHTDSDDKKTYSYKKVWSQSLIDSSEFKESGHGNPAAMPYKSEEFLAASVKIGAFSLSKGQIKKMFANRDLSLLDAKPARNLKISGDYMTSSADEVDPKVGDVRISWRYNDWEEVSVLAKQRSDSFEDFVSKSGKTINRVEKGLLSGRQIVDMVKTENKATKWFLRALGFAIVFGGYFLILGPISTIASFVPIFGTLVGGMLAVVSFLVGAVHSLVFIAIAWIRFRPILGIVLLALAAGLFFAARYLTKKNKA